MADTLVARVLGVERSTQLPVLTHVVVADDVLFGTREEAAHLSGHGPIPAELARELVKHAAQDSLAELRRLYVTRTTGELVAADSRSRCFPDGLAALSSCATSPAGRRGATHRSGTVIIPCR